MKTRYLSGTEQHSNIIPDTTSLLLAIYNHNKLHRSYPEDNYFFKTY